LLSHKIQIDEKKAIGKRPLKSLRVTRTSSSSSSTTTTKHAHRFPNNDAWKLGRRRRRSEVVFEDDKKKKKTNASNFVDVV